MSKILGALVAVAFAFSTNAAGAHDDGRQGHKKLPYPDVTDSTRATHRAADLIEGFFTAKSLHQAAQMVSFFASTPKPPTGPATGRSSSSRTLARSRNPEEHSAGLTVSGIGPPGGGPAEGGTTRPRRTISHSGSTRPSLVNARAGLSPGA